MGTVTGFTSTRMLGIEDNSVVSGSVVGDNLILTKHNGSTINAGNVRGATGAPGLTLAEFNAHMPVGVILDYIGTTAPTVKWLTMVGQVITGGQTLYPDLWAILPASMKSGVDIIMPDTRGRVSVGYNSSDTDFDAIGETGGAKTVTLTQAQTPLKSHGHSITDPGHSHTVNSHSHGGSTQWYDPVHNHGTTTSGGQNSNTTHTHGPNGTGLPTYKNFVFQTDSGSGSVQFVTSAGSYDINVVSSTNAANTDHTHNVSTNNANINHNHGISAEAPGTSSVVTSVSIVAASDATATAHNNVQPYITFLKIIKVA